MKKKIVIFALAALCAGSLTSCVDLDADKYFDDRTTLESIFSDRVQSLEWLSYAYSKLGGCNSEVCSKGPANMFCFDDCMYFGDRNDLYNYIRMGRYDENSDVRNSWYDMWRGINQATTFIHNIDKNKQMDAKMILDTKGQARFIRAYFYWLLLRKFGPVPILPEDGLDYTKTYDELSLPRNTYEEVAEYIGKEMVQAAKEIQYTTRDASEIGRPTKGACLATRALAYIYAASPLANGQLKNGQHDPSKVNDAIAQNFKNFDGTKLLSTEYDESKWARAAAACRDVMELGVYELYHVPYVSNGTDINPTTIIPPSDGNFSERMWPYGWKNIDPQKSYANLFNGAVGPAENPELIFGRVYNQGFDNDYSIRALVVHEMPQSSAGWNTHGITQKMVDAYYMNDGTDVPGKDSEYKGGSGEDRVKGWTTEENYKKYRPLGPNVSLQYANREPRFYATVAFSGCIWENGEHENKDMHNIQAFYYLGDQNGYKNNFQFPRTGIGVKKWYHPNDWVKLNDKDRTWNVKSKAETAIRYADILLMYAEALNELDGSYEIKSWDDKTTYNISRDINEIKKGIQPVRIRGGVPDYDNATYADKNLLRAKIKRERMIELFGEGKRYFDLRRWMDAPVEESEPIYGLNIFMPSDRRDDFMKVIKTNSLQQTFVDRMYFWPICFDELKNDKNLVQVPGWKYND